jgi:hypothetical protein
VFCGFVSVDERSGASWISSSVARGFDRPFALRSIRLLLTDRGGGGGGSSGAGVDVVSVVSPNKKSG